MDKKIKVVRIINRFNLGGPTFNATFLTRFLSDEFETTLIGGVPDKGETNSLHILKEYGIKPIILPEMSRAINISQEYRAYKKIKKILKEIQPDIVHTHASKAGLLGRMAAFSLRIPVVVHTFHGHVFHSYFGKFKTTFFKQIERYLAKKSTGIIAISALQKHELADVHKIVNQEKIKVIPLGFDLQKFQEGRIEKREAVRAQYKLSDDEVAITIIGRLAPIKDHDYFLNVIEEVLKQTPQEIKVFIVGDGSEKNHIEDRVNKLNEAYPNRIMMTSWILDIATFIQGMDIVCLTSKNEGTPVSLIEAQAAGVPVISTDVGGVRDAMEDGKSGFVVKRENIETYIKNLRLLIEDDKLREKISIFGQKNATEKFGYQRLVLEMEDYYKELLKR